MFNCQLSFVIYLPFAHRMGRRRRRRWFVVELRLLRMLRFILVVLEVVFRIHEDAGMLCDFLLDAGMRSDERLQFGMLRQVIRIRQECRILTEILFNA